METAAIRRRRFLAEGRAASEPHPPYTLTCYRASTRMSDRKAVIKNADMAEEMQQDAVDCATQALEKFNIEKVREFCLMSGTDK